jgi:hypothetical protein
MRGFEDGLVPEAKTPQMTGFQGGFASALQQSPLETINSYMQLSKLPSTPTIDPPQLKIDYPDSGDIFDVPMSRERAELIYDRHRIGRQFDMAQNFKIDDKTGAGKNASGSMLGSLIDPVGFAAGYGGGKLVSMAYTLGKGASLATKIGHGIVDNFVGNLAVDVPVLGMHRALRDPEDLQGMLLGNIAASTVMGGLGATAGHYLGHYFRSSKNLIDTLEAGTEGRTASGLSVDGGGKILDAAVASENDGKNFQYTHEKFSPDKPFYSGSNTYTEDFNAAELASRTDTGTERGATAFDREDTAHAGALSEGSHNTGTVFSHDIKDTPLIDGDMRLDDVGLEETINILNILNKTKEKYVPLPDHAEGVKIFAAALGKEENGMFSTVEFNKALASIRISKFELPVHWYGLDNALEAINNFILKFDIKGVDINNITLVEATKLMAREMRVTKDAARKTAMMEMFREFREGLLRDADEPLRQGGFPEIMRVFNSAKQKSLVSYKAGMTLRSAYNEILNAHYSGQLPLSDVIAFEKSLGAKGMHFVADNYRGIPHEPTNAVYMFNKNDLQPTGVKDADPRSVGSIKSPKVMQITKEVNGQNKLFDYTYDEAYKTWPGLDAETKKINAETRARRSPKNKNVIDIKDDIIDSQIESLQVGLKNRAAIEGHMTPENKLILDEVTAELSALEKTAAQMDTIKGCVD